MITISENATPMTLLPNGSLVQLQEARVPLFFIPKTIVICNTRLISANVRVLQEKKETFFKLVLNILTHQLALNIHMEDKFIPNVKIHISKFTS